ncbi:hypothetical protein [Amycolatopsis sp. 195334CR]|uniref:hypothetical protein n=1 Tax=Amycolatopsis sp. 195334CR TaxID=2814588 RepID=UPI001A903A00|nr:hypothetical protein [Amycolatopsis sp. 195334CR]MBN6039289.1 hypothetical protein [Amycolatopsis sp. 195334CR]
MTAAAWVCDSCDTNNLPGADRCRTCRQSPGSATGEVRTVPEAVTPRRRQTRLAPGTPPSETTSRARIALTPPSPPPVKPTTPPPPAETVPPRRSIRTPVAVAVTVGIAGFIGWATLGEQSPEPAPSAPAKAENACPDTAATWLPANGSGAVLVAAYTTEKHEIVVCRTVSGQHYYDGRKKGQPATPETHISLEASRTPDGFIAHNKGYRYEIRGTELTVTHKNEEKSRETLHRTGP